MSSSDSCSHGSGDAAPPFASTQASTPEARAAIHHAPARRQRCARSGPGRSSSALFGPRLSAGALLLAVMTAATSALADARTEARRHFKAGMELIADKKYEQGLKELEKANEILPHPNVTFNIARAHAEAGNLAQAISAYRQYLQSDPPDREKVSQIVQQLDARLNAQRAAAAEPPQPSLPPPEPPKPKP